jgi:hypothetical protein
LNETGIFLKESWKDAYGVDKHGSMARSIMNGALGCMIGSGK